MPNDARNKLRSMGGIMASSPELMQAAMQRFQLGGNVSVRPPGSPNAMSPLPTIPVVPPMAQPGLGPRRSGYAPGLLSTGIADPRLSGTARRAPLSPTQARENAILERLLMEQRMGGPLTVGGGAIPFPVDPSTPEGLGAGMQDRVVRNVEAGEGSIGAEAGVTIDDLLNQSEITGLSLPEEGLSMPGPELPPTGRRARARGEVRPPATRIETLEELDRKISNLKSMPRRPAITQRIKQLETERAALIQGRGVEALEGPESTGLGAQRLGPNGFPVSAEELEPVLGPVTNMGQEDKARVTEKAVAALKKSAAKSAVGDADVSGGASGGGRNGRANASQKSSLRSSFNENLKLFQEVFGTNDEDIAKDRAMSLAMMGLAIASGTSPDALTNIAQGALVGAQSFSEAEARRRQQEQEIKRLALETAVDDRAAREAFARDLLLKDLENAAKSPDIYGDTPVSIETPFGKVDVFKPTFTGASQGLQTRVLNPEDLTRRYEDSLKERGSLLGLVDESLDLIAANPGQIAGIGGAFERLKNQMGAAMPDALQQLIGIDPATAAEDPVQRYDVIMRNLAAKLAPTLLGESGRTISDGDRARVARLLGFAVDESSIDGNDGIILTGFIRTAIKSEAELQSALRQVRSTINTAYSEHDSSYRTLMGDEPYNQLQKQYGFNQPPADEALDDDALLDKWTGGGS